MASADTAADVSPHASSSSRSTHSAETLADRDAVDLEKAEKKAGEGEDAEHSRSGEPLGQEEVKAPAPPKQEEDPFLVTIKGRESLNPHTWAVWYRWCITALAGLLVLNATFASSAPANLIASIITHYHVSQEVGILLISVFVAGYCLGPLLFGPLSERYGRRFVFLVVWGPYIGFQIGCALSPNIGALIVFRFLGGCFASAPLTVSGGVIADLWDADRRGDALAVFALMPFAGPALAPIISGAMQVRGVDFRWIFWLLTMFAGLCGVLFVFLLPETYVPYILATEAKRLRKETGDDRWHAALEKKNTDGFKGTLKRTVLKPFIMIIEEPMLLVITLYMSLVYGVVYLLFEAIPIVFEGVHGLNPLESGLVFLALLTGGVLGVLGYVLYFNRKYMAIHRAIKPRMVAPEERLKPLMYAAPAFALAFFWFGLTGAYKSVSIWSPILAVVLLGACVLYVFLTSFNYIFPLFTVQMYDRLGIQGACCLLGGLAILFIPIPFVLIKYGKRIRGLSKNALVLD
ncbi:hypothetical protein JCM10450v2_003616 [Rhodotorula kratochvilovae]